MSNANTIPKVNTPAFWDYYMKNKWDSNNGGLQTRLFAKYFLDTVRLPFDSGSLLDISCAKGDALPEIHSRYPNLKLYGTDIAESAILDAQKTYGDIANFTVAGFDDLNRQYDIILCSNTLEHFVDYLPIARRMLANCKYLYVMVPFRELRNGAPLRPEQGQQHVTTFDEDSFNSLIESGEAVRIQTWVLYTPGAWGNGPVTLWQRIKAKLRNRPAPNPQRQIIYEIQNANL